MTKKINKGEKMNLVMKKREKKYVGAKKGFSLWEILIAIAIVAIIASIIIGKVISNEQMSTYETTLNSDVKSIIYAANQWKSNSPQSDGTWNNITTDSICPYLPSNMQCVNGYVESSHYKGLIHYQILPYKVTDNGDSLKLFVNISGPVLNKDLTQKAEQVGMDIAAKFSADPKTVVEDGIATAIGNANAAFTDGGTTDDGMFGVAGIKQ